MAVTNRGYMYINSVHDVSVYMLCSHLILKIVKFFFYFIHIFHEKIKDFYD